MADIEPGSKIKVTVTKELRSEAAAKTLARLFLKDPKIAKTRRKDPKPIDPRTRAGRLWNVRPRGSAAARPNKGESCEITCTLDVVRDLGSVENYVEITKV
ncbi:MAG: hypothetical protein JXQ73_24875 [Phycisphaerae bacterium]|nr:hypothetical protein [Phycisphaerae bacterium]